MNKNVISANWSLTTDVNALMTCRQGGKSAGGYQSNNLGIYVGDEHAPDNRRALVETLKLPNEPLWLKQVHGTACHYAAGLKKEFQSDAVWTDVPGQVLAIQTADCLPVVFADKNASVVAAAHAGWRGLAGGVLENTLAAMPVKPEQIHVWLGAAIGPCCFEVGDEVRSAFVDEHPEDSTAFVPATGGKWMADLYQLARARLYRHGVTTVAGESACTSCELQRYYSYRRDAGLTGRMATLIWLSER